MNACDRAREAFNRADRRAEVLRNRWETLLTIEAQRVHVRKMRDERKAAKSHE